MLVLAGFVTFLILVKKKSSCNKCPPGGLKKWIEFSKTAKKYTSKKKYNSFCKMRQMIIGLKLSVFKVTRIQTGFTIS